MEFYFAYGTDMDPTELRRTCPGAELAGPAYAPERRITFDRLRGGAGAGGANLVHDLRFLTWGVLYRVSPGELLALDSLEGYHLGRPGQSTSLRVQIDVQVPGHGPVRAHAYVAAPHVSGAPPAGYVDRLIHAARAQDLPFDYIASLGSRA